MHTNLEFNDEENEYYSVIDDYDALCRSDLLTKIIDTFKDDYASCQEILNMMTADRLQDNMTIEKKMYQFLDSIKEMLSAGIDNITSKLNIDELMEFDPEKLTQLLGLIGNKE